MKQSRIEFAKLVDELCTCLKHETLKFIDLNNDKMDGNISIILDLMIAGHMSSMIGVVKYATILTENENLIKKISKFLCKIAESVNKATDEFNKDSTEKYN